MTFLMLMTYLVTACKVTELNYITGILLHLSTFVMKAIITEAYFLNKLEIFLIARLKCSIMHPALSSDPFLFNVCYENR